MSFRERQIAADGRAIIEVIPKDDIRDREKLKTFVREVRTVEPHATERTTSTLSTGSFVIRKALFLSLTICKAGRG